MIDIHAHILPGLDDGAEDLETALEMAEQAEESGVKVIVATPHCMHFRKQQNLWDGNLRQAIADFRAELEYNNINLKIVPGMEIFGTPQVPRYLREKRMIGLNGSQYPLIEFEFHNYGAQATAILEEVVDLGMRPVVAHPERYSYVQQDPSILNMWVDMGCLLQINKGSLMGSFGSRARALSMELVDRNFAFAVASDAHAARSRTTRMEDVSELLAEAFSPKTAKSLLESNPMQILRNETIQAVEPDWFR